MIDKSLTIFFFFIIALSSCSVTNNAYSPNKKYGKEKLQEDYSLLKNILQKKWNRSKRADFLVFAANEMLQENISDIARKFEKVFEITRFDEILPAHENRESALRFLLPGSLP